MTREEAIKGLKVLRKDFSGYKPNEEMFDIAIEALEQKEKSEYEHDHAVVKAYTDGQTYILDKIRTEIISLTNSDTPERIWNVDVIKIIDKYGGE